MKHHNSRDDGANGASLDPTHFAKGHQAMDPGIRFPKDKLVDQKMVTHQQVIFHGWRWDLVSLNNERGSKQCQDYGYNQAFEIFPKC